MWDNAKREDGTGMDSARGSSGGETMLTDGKQPDQSERTILPDTISVVPLFLMWAGGFDHTGMGDSDFKPVSVQHLAC